LSVSRITQKVVDEFLQELFAYLLQSGILLEETQYRNTAVLQTHIITSSLADDITHRNKQIHHKYEARLTIYEIKIKVTEV